MKGCCLQLPRRGRLLGRLVGHVLGDGFGSLRHGVFRQLSGQNEADGRLQNEGLETGRILSIILMTDIVKLSNFLFSTWISLDDMVDRLL